MSRGPQTFRQRDLTAALKAARAAGCEVSRVEVGKDGRIIVILMSSKDQPAAWRPRLLRQRMGQHPGMTKIRLPYIHEFRDRHGKVRRYARPPGRKQTPLPGAPGSAEFMEAYQAALAGERPRGQIG